ncbi:uncharacterized protein LOC121730569 [Aricia agestis]|uniref:uncharacterized protein LOC121730569 n=1 Tax=Aricia agestis TaxID=91739 RepID=UPI001C20284D|nr:uncharacterized protein LOC121730569 [Aricia agestis]
MLKRVLVICLLISCYACADSDVLEAETRAKKKKSSAKLIGILLLLAISKIAIFKTISIFLTMKFFQKLLMVGGVLLKYFLSDKPATVYGAPSYDTVGYSYQEQSQQGYPGMSDVANFDWLVNKNV